MNSKQDLERAVEQLRSLKAHCESMKESGEEWKKDIQALEYAIEKLTKTYQEVPVQEQCDMNFNPNTGEKLHDICPKCWVKGNKPFNCGFNTCPGYKLHTLSINKKY